MQLAKVNGNVVSSIKNEHLTGHKLLLVRAIDTKGTYISEKDIIAIDQVDAGIGDIVLITQEGDAVQQILGHKKAPVNTIIVAVVDDLELVE